METSSQLLTIALQQGGAVIVAVFAIWMLRREYQERLADQEERLRLEQERVKGEREDKLTMLQIIKENTEAVTSLKSVVQRLCDNIRASSREEY